MRVELIPTVNEAKQERILRRTIVVIDVLRSTSTIVAAFLSGIMEVIPVETCGQAYPLRDKNTLLAGERFCKKVQGFDFSNSPTEILSQPIAGKSLVLSTTNGTRAIQKALKGDHVLIGSFLNASAVADTISALSKDTTLFCSGTRDEFALEDALCAGYLLDRLIQKGIMLESDDFAKITHAAYLQVKDQLSHVLTTTTTGKRLVQLGLLEDIAYSSLIDRCGLVPYVKDGRIFVHSST